MVFGHNYIRFSHLQKHFTIEFTGTAALKLWAEQCHNQKVDVAQSQNWTENRAEMVSIWSFIGDL